MSLVVNLSRTVSRRAAADVAQKHLTAAVKAALKSTRFLSLTKVSVTLTDGGYTATVVLSGRVSEQYQQQFLGVLAGILAQRFDPPWVILTGKEGEVPAAGGDETVKIAERPVGRVNLDFPEHTFERIYGRDAHIRRVVDALRIGQDTHWAKRKHTLLSGPPGCGKTELCLTLARALGTEGEAWLWFDATSTTKAGAIEQLMKAPTLPPILFVEEIEKCQENALRWLLGVMDERGELRRVNYRVGNENKKTPLTLVATANNVDALKAIDSGAIYSRFGNRIHCPPPDRNVLECILNREVAEIGGNPRWVGLALDFGYDQLHIEDCREIINIMLCGRDRLFDGSFQRDFLETMPPEDRDGISVDRTIQETFDFAYSDN